LNTRVVRDCSGFPRSSSLLRRISSIRSRRLSVDRRPGHSIIFHIDDSNGSDGDGNGDRQQRRRWQWRPVTVVVVTVADSGDRVVVVPHSGERENAWSSGSFFFFFFPPGWRPGFLTRPTFDRTCICLGAFYPIVVVPEQRPSCNERAKNRRIRRCVTCIARSDPSDLAAVVSPSRANSVISIFFLSPLSILFSWSAART